MLSIERVKEIFNANSAERNFWDLQSFRMYVHHRDVLSYINKGASDKVRSVALYLVFEGNRDKCKDFLKKKDASFLESYREYQAQIDAIILENEKCETVEEEKDHGFVLITVSS